MNYFTKNIILLSLISLTLTLSMPANATRDTLDKIFKEVSEPLNRLKLNLEITKARMLSSVTIGSLKRPLTTREQYLIENWATEFDSYNSSLRLDINNLTTQELESALIKYPPYQRKVYRSGSDTNNVFKDGLISEGDIVLDKGFLATTSSPEYAKVSFPDRNVRFVIQPRGSAYDIAEVRGDQSEVLFRPKTPFKVKKIQEFEGKTYVYLEESDTMNWKGVKNLYTGEVYLKESPILESTCL